jgi:predicted ribosome quality control (RQC) complex YloA/Tae2 family protein
MGLSEEEIAAVIEEVGPVLTGGWIQKISQPSPFSIVLEVRVPGRTLPLLLSADPDTARLHVLARKWPNPPTPPAFCQFLRARIQGARVDGIVQVPGDRIVRVNLIARAGPCTLVAELTGRQADLLLLDGHETVLATIHKDRDRVGHPYRPPALRPHGARTRGSVESWPPSGGDRPFPVSAALEEQYGRREADLQHARLRQARLAELNQRMKRAARRLEALRADLARASRYQHYARYGELVKANLGHITKGDERITVVDFFDPAQPELVIPLDPSKTPRGNMDDYFSKHRKYLAASKEILPRIAHIERELDAMRTERQAIQDGSWTPPLVPSPCPSPSGERKKARAASRAGPFRRFTSADGLPIYVGRNAKENEELTLKFAHGDDLWLHAQGVPGSHVVVRLDKGAAPPPETLKDAATLALLYSDLRKSGKGDVIYTRRKHVRKAKGHPPGTVTVTQEKAIHLQLDRARLERLKETR